MKNLPLWPFLAFQSIVESVSSEESMSDWGTNPPPATMNAHGRNAVAFTRLLTLQFHESWLGATSRCRGKSYCLSATASRVDANVEQTIRVYR